MPITKRVADVVGRNAEERILGERFVLPELGGGRRSRPTGKMKSRRKLLEFAAESPTSGARFVGWRFWKLLLATGVARQGRQDNMTKQCT